MYFFYLFEIILKSFKEGYSPQLIRFIFLIWVLVDNKQSKYIHLSMFSWRAAHLLGDKDNAYFKIK